MKFQFCSDLHLEFEANTRFLSQFPINPEADILILAGDITYLRQDFYQHRFFDYIANHWKQCYWVPGNHEFYCGIDIKNYDFSKPVPIRKNVFLINNQTITIKNIKLIFSTLWSEIENKYAHYIQQNMADFRLIVYNEHKLNANSFNQLHTQAFDFIQKEVEKYPTTKKIIVTHHLPSLRCNHPDFYGSALNSAFCVDLTEFIKKNNIDAWIYGHSHRNMPDFYIKNTLLTTNQLGYIHHSEHKNFKLNKTIEIN